MRSEEQKQADLDIVKNHTEALGEHFDHVQIFCGRHMPAEAEGTVSVNWGSGNWFSRYGQVHEWMVYQDGRVKAHAITDTNQE